MSVIFVHMIYSEDPSTAPDEAARHDLVDIVVAAEGLKGWATAAQAAATSALFRQFETSNLPANGRQVSPAERHDAEQRAARSTALSLSLALGISLTAADRRLALAVGLADQPLLAEALRTGRADEAQVRTIHEETLSMPAEPRDRLVESVAGPAPTLLPDGVTLWSLPPHRLRPLLSAAVADACPDLVADRSEIARSRRNVAHCASSLERPGALVLHGPDELLAASFASLDATARAARRAGAAETLDQLRFDLAVGAITHGAYGLSVGQPAQRLRRSTLVNITVSAATLIGLDDRPATLHSPSGDLPLPAGVARRLAEDPDQATWRRILCDPATGTATDVSTTYRPPRRIAELCSVRDGHTSRFPTSGARTIELDHVVEFDHHEPAAGGRTTSANLASSGKRDHQAKTDRLLRVSGDANEVLTYSTGTGHTYRSRPHRYLPPPPTPDLGEPPF